MEKPTRVQNVDHLKELLAQGQKDYFILLEGAVRSRKTIRYDQNTDTFSVIHRIDGIRKKNEWKCVSAFAHEGSETALHGVAVLMVGALLLLPGEGTFAGERVSDAPRIENFRITPDTFSLGQAVTVSFDYKNVRGGLRRAKVAFNYKGSQGNRYKSSRFTGYITGDGEENGTFRTMFFIRPTDSPPFGISYSLRIIDTEGRKSKWAYTNVKFVN